MVGGAGHAGGRRPIPRSRRTAYLGETTTSDGVPFQLVTTPVQFAGAPAPPKRAPEFNEHCEEILAGIDCSADEMMELKVAGVVA